MCGLVGFCGSELGKSVRKDVCLKMIEKIKHRGPDDDGVFDDGFMTLGFARLKIVDLDGGAQPMISKDGRYALCFNGEIYNYKELRDRFPEMNLNGGDTEVLLEMLIRYKERALEYLRGMFAFAFYDSKEKRLILARDPFGIKPLYYGVFNDCLIFASEIKAFIPHPQFEKRFNDKILPYYLQFQYVPLEETAFCNVKRLMPGSILIYQNGQMSVEKYFYHSVYFKDGYKGYEFFKESIEEKHEKKPYGNHLNSFEKRLFEVIEESVSKHKRADVPIGGFLSGGVDSGFICAMAQPEKTYTIGFKKSSFDERAQALHTAKRLGISLDITEIDADDFFDSILAVQYHSDEPYANLSAVPLYLLSKRAAREVKVVLSGEGADELFGGYEWYQDSYFGKIYRKLPEKIRKTAARKALQGRIGDFMRRNSSDAGKEFIGQAKIMRENEAKQLLRKSYQDTLSPLSITSPIYSNVRNASLLRQKMYLDSHLWLPCDILNKADKMTMASSLELRVPYLDLEVYKLSQACSDKLLMRGKTGKYVLRKCAENLLDKEGAYRAKKGFPVPFRNWIREKRYAKILEDAFKGETCDNFFDRQLILKLLDEHVKGIKNNARKLYTVYAFLVWYKIFFENERSEKDEGVSADNSRLG